MRYFKLLIPLTVPVILFFASCRQTSKGPDVSGIRVNARFERFDRDLQAIDTNLAATGLQQLYAKYPQLTPVFLYNILGLDSATAVPGLKRFLSLSGALFDTINVVFRNTEGLEKQFEEAFRHLKYYFPDYPQPRIVTIAGPVDALAESEMGPTPNFLRPGLLGISLQFYLGPGFSIYNDPFFIQSVAPSWRSRRFSKEYMIADAMQLVVSDLFPDNSGGKPLVEQMVEKGKRWYLLDKLLPGVPDTIKTGYTAGQLDWCRKNEGLIWSYIIQTEDLQSLNPTVIQNYIGEGPFTQGFSQEDSPGNLGQWIGWQIVKKFAARNKDLTPAELMRYDTRKLLEEAKYKPK